MYQGGDIVAQLGSGSPLSMIAMQQGPQIAQIFAGPGGASVKGAVTQAGEAMGSFARRVGVVGGSFGAVTTAAVVGVTAMVSYQNSVRETERMVSGVGRASGVTAAQIGRLCPRRVGCDRYQHPVRSGGWWRDRLDRSRRGRDGRQAGRQPEGLCQDYGSGDSRCVAGPRQGVRRPRKGRRPAQ